MTFSCQVEISHILLKINSKISTKVGNVLLPNNHEDLMSIEVLCAIGGGGRGRESVRGEREKDQHRRGDGKRKGGGRCW